MLSRSPASRTSRSCSRVLNHPQVGSRQLRRGTASFLTQRPNNTTTPRRTLPSTAIPYTSAKGPCVPQLERWQAGKRLASSAASAASAAPADSADTPSHTTSKDEIYALIDKINQNEIEIAELIDDLKLFDGDQGTLDVDDPELDPTIEHRDEQTLESRVQAARRQFGETLPEGYLDEAEMQLYTRLYGEPIVQQTELEVQQTGDEEDPNRLYREDGLGGWEEVELEDAESQDGPEVVYDMEVGPPVDETDAMRRTREVAEQLGGEVMLEEFEDEAVPGSTPRLHPLTSEGKFATDPKTIHMPRDSMTIPINAILSNFSNKHIAEVAHRVFGGTKLPHSTTTLAPRAQVSQLPIPLQASQRHMSEMEANTYIAALYPGMYASTLSILTEVRKRLGSDWIRGLMSQEGGPSVLDAGGGGAGVLAWRDVLRAESEAMDPGRPPTDPIFVGKSTVIAAPESLQARASLMLENTTFLPRLPDYVHVRGKPTLDDDRVPRRKHYDIIIAPHTIMGIDEEYMRKDHVENLWSLLNPDGGVLILFEKGRQRGFEAIAGAREMLLKRHISNPGSTEYENFLESPGESPTVEKEPGMIIAPCTNHEKCPMYAGGATKGRKDYCHFEQRYIRPPFLQRIIGARDRNHEDVQFSYLAVQRGIDLRQKNGIVQGPKASETAFAGFEHLTAEANPEAAAAALPPPPTPQDPATTEHTAPKHTEPFHALALPRTVYQPMKRRGHVIFDVCTPAAKIERWTVPRSYSRQAYRDARKAHWGDLWALGAKTAIPKKLALGDKHGEGKKERMEKRAATKEAMQEEENEEFDADEEGEPSSKKLPDLPIPVKKKGQYVPSWKKHADKKKLRQAVRKRSVAQMEKELS